MANDYDDVTIQVVNQLFENLFSICKAWKVALGDDQAVGDCKRQWLSAFKENNISSIDKVKRGMVKMRSRQLPFLPSPGEFIALCKLQPIDVGAPSVENAYKEAVKNAYPDGLEKRWTHPCVRYAYQQSGAFDMRTEPKSKTYPLFEKNYINSLEDYAEGKILNQIQNNKPKSQGKHAPVTGFGGYEWSKPGVMKQYECIRSYEDAMDVIDNICKLNPKMRAIKRLVHSLNTPNKAV